MQRFTTQCAVAAICLAAIGGCQSHRARPLDLGAYRQEWLDRQPGSAGVAEFAKQFAGEPGAAAFDLSDGLSLPEAEVVALFYNPDLRVARLRAGVTSAAAANAALWQDPTLSVDGGRILESVAEPWKVFATLGITLPVSGRLEAERARAGAEHTGTLARIAEQEWGVRVSVRATWLEWSASAAKLAAARDLQQRLEQITTITERLRSAGELSATEARPFLAERVMRRGDLRQLEAEAAERELAVRAVLGLSPEAPLSLSPLLGIDAGETREIGPESPSLAAAAAEYEVAERSLALEIRKQYPDLVIGPGYGYEDGNSQALLGISLPLPLWNANRGGIATATADREVSRAAYETTFERLAGALAAARTRLAAAGDRRRLLEEELIPLVEAQYRDARAIAELGEVDTLLLLDTLTRQYESKLMLVDARLAESLAAVRIQELVGPAPAKAGPGEEAAP